MQASKFRLIQLDVEGWTLIVPESYYLASEKEIEEKLAAVVQEILVIGLCQIQSMENPSSLHVKYMIGCMLKESLLKIRKLLIEYFYGI